MVGKVRCQPGVGPLTAGSLTRVERTRRRCKQQKSRRHSTNTRAQRPGSRKLCPYQTGESHAGPHAPNDEADDEEVVSFPDLMVPCVLVELVPSRVARPKIHVGDEP